ncbi:hypothetical protein P4B35_04045 [Pontiellaceae bacterium B12227]|nr:hypothetical protein [Pontiellaceae bacterium B12227]
MHHKMRNTMRLMLFDVLVSMSCLVLLMPVTDFSMVMRDFGFSRSVDFRLGSALMSLGGFCESRS